MLGALQNIFNSIMHSADLPLLTAFMLGLLVAINPCQLAINVSALSYEYKTARRWIDGLSYVLGRSITYTLMGWVLMCLIGGGRNIDGVSLVLSKAEAVVPYVLLIIGLCMTYRAVHPHHHHDDNCHNCRQLIRRNGPLGSLVLGMTLALAFCPESAVFYFGMMLPLATASNVGVLVPPAFSIGAAVPVLFLSWVMLRAFLRASTLSTVFSHMQRWLNALVGIMFIILAIMLFVE